MKHFAGLINANMPNNRQLGYIGVAGDLNPKGEYSPLFPDFDIVTVDADVKWSPDIVADITDTKLPPNYFGAIVCVQVIEHIRNLWDLPRELDRILCPSGFVIIDCPWNYPYHAEAPSFGDYWRVSKDGMRALFGDLFEIIDVRADHHNTSCLLLKR